MGHYAQLYFADDQGEPEEIATEQELTSKIISENVGKYYLYTGSTGTYHNDSLYEIQEVNE